MGHGFCEQARGQKGPPAAHDTALASIELSLIGVFSVFHHNTDSSAIDLNSKMTGSHLHDTALLTLTV